MSRRDLATLYGVGLLPGAPGTWGSAVAAILAFVILMFPYGWALLLLLVAWSLWAGTRASTRHMAEFNTAHDPSEIIVDELNGQWLTYSVWHVWMVVLTSIDNTVPDFDTVVALLNHIGGSPLELALGFVLFRFFDILKPWPISLADRKVKGGFGVMFDDVLAGLAAGTVLAVFHVFSPLLLGPVAESAV
ncbi:MAG: phosphatidylglycerophosphatase A [Alphaproteobacteria bacterium]